MKLDLILLILLAAVGGSMTAAMLFDMPPWQGLVVYAIASVFEVAALGAYRWVHAHG